MWVGVGLGTECTADIRRDNAHALGWERKCPGDIILNPVRSLVRVVEGDAISAPGCDCCMRFKWVVVVGRRRIGVVELDGSVCECGLNVATESVSLVAGIDLLWLVQVPAVCAQLDVMRLLLITYYDETYGLARNLQCLSDDDGNELTTVGHGIRLEHCKFCIIKRHETWRIFVREHGHDPGKHTCGARVDRHNPAPGNRALHRKRVCHAFDRVLVGVGRCAGDLLWTIDTVQWLTNSPYGEVHHLFSSFVRSSNVRTRMLRASGTLKALSRKGCASTSSAAAARRNTSSVAAAPRKTDSAFVARHGTCATPPKAMRTSRTMPP